MCVYFDVNQTATASAITNPNMDSNASKMLFSKLKITLIAKF